MFGFGKNNGRELANRVADHLRIERNLFDTALLELGFTWQHWKQLAEGALPIETTANDIRPQLLRGLGSLRQKFGEQQEIVAAMNALEQGDINTDVAASAAAKMKMIVDPDLPPDSTIDVIRHQALAAWIDSIETPGGMDGARITAGLWASVADRSCSIQTVAYEVNVPLSRTERACQALYEAGVMARAKGRDGLTYYKLSEVGMHAGQQISRQWLAITQLYPGGNS